MRILIDVSVEGAQDFLRLALRGVCSSSCVTSDIAVATIFVASIEADARTHCS